jgi:ATP-dependent RNA circularization protein (DNA/RNA ligase family)
MTVYLLNQEFGVCSRNLDLKRDENNTLWQVAIAQDLETKLRDAFEDNIAVQGEVIGEGIQGNIYRIKGHQFLVYDIYDIKNNQYFYPEARRLICEEASILHVPIEQENLSLAEEPDLTIDNLLSIANGHSQLGNHPQREGLVLKSLDRSGERISFKVISNDYLLKRSGG